MSNAAETPPETLLDSYLAEYGLLLLDPTGRSRALLTPEMADSPQAIEERTQGFAELIAMLIQGQVEAHSGPLTEVVTVAELGQETLEGDVAARAIAVGGVMRVMDILEEEWLIAIRSRSDNSRQPLTETEFRQTYAAGMGLLAGGQVYIHSNEDLLRVLLIPLDSQPAA